MDEILKLKPVRRGLIRRLCSMCSRLIDTVALNPRCRSIGSGSIIQRPRSLHQLSGLELGDHVNIWPGSRIECIGTDQGIGSITIGSGTVIQPGVHLGAAQEISIGASCLFASGVYVTDHDHDCSNLDEPVVSNGRIVADPVRIGDQAWLGEKVIVLKGVTIGQRCVIGAGSVVTHDIPADSIAVGTPARVIRSWCPETSSWKQEKA